MIVGRNIILRTVKESDIEQIIPLQSDISQRGEFLNPKIVSELMYRKRFNETGFWNEDYGCLLITDKGGRLLGEISCFKGGFYLPGYEISYNIYRREDRGKGYTTEALKLFSAFLFESKPIQRLEIHADVNNIGSCRVAEKAGFTFEGVKRQAVFARGRYCDLALYSLLRHECQSLSELIMDESST